VPKRGGADEDGTFGAVNPLRARGAAAAAAGAAKGAAKGANKGAGEAE
jgi:hypothetical protein